MLIAQLLSAFFLYQLYKYSDKPMQSTVLTIRIRNMALQCNTVGLALLLLTATSFSSDVEKPATDSEVSRHLQAAAAVGNHDLSNASSANCTGWQYGSSCYHLVREEYDFFTAEAYCILQYNGHLAAPTSRGENSFLKMKLITTYESEFESALRVWLGAYKLDNNNTWIFTSGEPVFYTDWFEGHPDEAGDACAYYFGLMITNDFFPWVDTDCYNEFYKYPFLCEEN